MQTTSITTDSQTTTETDIAQTSAQPERSITEGLEVDDLEVLHGLTGPGSALLRDVAKHSGSEVGLRGNVILISGPESRVLAAHRFLTEAIELVRNGVELGPGDVARSLRALHDHPDGSLVDLLDATIKVAPKRRPVVPKTPAQRHYVSSIREHDLTFGIGPAGTGKTYLAMAMGVNALINRRVKRIILTRPAVEAGEKLGFLPGDLAEKVNPYLRPLYDALNDMMEFEKVESLRERGQIEVAPLAFMRGRTLNNSFIILDEAQNATSEQMRMFLTRLGYSSKAVVTGDITQTDLPSGAKSGLKEASELFSNIEGIAFCRFSDGDVVRHPLVQRIVLAYEALDRTREAEKTHKSDRRRGSLSATKGDEDERE
ncbi:MAG: PhoH family protein [Polyangiaceae bacterium]